ncbi:MAG: protein jag, partial [Selenomonadaceae bacterium]|nr:protein jag [Selenomonadaceae bacterium]
MAVEIEKTGKTIDEAKQAALSELQVSADMVEFEVLAEPSKGFLGLIGGRPARILARVRELTPADKAKKFLSDIFAAMNLDVTIEVSEAEDGVVLNLIGDNLGILIGKHGQTLDSLQYLSNLTANKGLLEEKVRIILDIENYRSRREETLRRLALRLADKVRRTGERIVLEPMNRHERKIIHMALQDNYRISTYSSGDEPYRKVVIEQKRGRRERRDYRGEYRGSRESRYSREPISTNTDSGSEFS